MDRITEIIEQRKAAGRRLHALGSEVFSSFLDMEKAAFRPGALGTKEKELIAVGIAVHGACESCMEWHIRQAAAHGATQREVLEAIEVAMEMGGGCATVSARFALEVMDHVLPEN